MTLGSASGNYAVGVERLNGFWGSTRLPCVGAFTKTITINSNAKTSTKVITIKGTVEAAEVVQDAMPLKKIENGATPLEKSNQ
jgi:hypothetical protein